MIKIIIIKALITSVMFSFHFFICKEQGQGIDMALTIKCKEFVIGYKLIMKV